MSPPGGAVREADAVEKCRTGQQAEHREFDGVKGFSEPEGLAVGLGAGVRWREALRAPVQAPDAPR